MGKRKRKKKEGTLAGARTRVLKLKVEPTSYRGTEYLDRRPVFFFFRENVALHTAHARDTRQYVMRVTHGTRHAARPNLDDHVPQTCPGTENPALWQAVPFHRDTYYKVPRGVAQERNGKHTALRYCIMRI